MDFIPQLHQFDFFKEFTENELKKLLSSSGEKSYPANTIIIEEAATGTELYVALEGFANIELLDPTNSKQFKRLAIVKAGEIFGEMAFLSGGRRSAQVRSMTPFKVLEFNTDKLIDLFESEHRLGYLFYKHIARIVCDKLKNTDLQWRNVV